MRDPQRIKEILSKFEAYWVRHPDLRFGQIISNLFLNTLKDIFYLEDDVVYAKLQSVTKEEDNYFWPSFLPKEQGFYWVKNLKVKCNLPHIEFLSLYEPAVVKVYVDFEGTWRVTHPDMEDDIYYQEIIGAEWNGPITEPK